MGVFRNRCEDSRQSRGTPHRSKVARQAHRPVRQPPVNDQCQPDCRKTAHRPKATASGRHGPTKSPFGTAPRFPPLPSSSKARANTLPVWGDRCFRLKPRFFRRFFRSRLLFSRIDSPREERLSARRWCDPLQRSRAAVGRINPEAPGRRRDPGRGGEGYRRPRLAGQSITSSDRVNPSSPRPFGSRIHFRPSTTNW